MNIGVTEISPRAVQQVAEKKFKDGYYCCEALMSAIREEFKLDVPKEVIAMSSGMAVGAGKSGCVCGAFNGGVLALGLFFGRILIDSHSFETHHVPQDDYRRFAKSNHGKRGRNVPDGPYVT